MALKSHGVTETTAQDILLSAGAYYKDLKYTEGSGWDGEILGATSGGGKVTIEPEYLDLEVDGATVLVKGLKQKVAEKASMEINLTEFREGLIADALHLVEDKTAKIDGYKKYISKRNISDEDYLENIAFVGTKVDGEQIIIIFPNAIITGAFEIEGKNKEQCTYTITAECTATFEQDDLEHLPYEIYYPQQAV